MTPPITQEDFDAWREHPITQLLMKGFSAQAAKAKAQWQADAWSNEWLTAEGRERQLVSLNRIKVRAEAYREITEVDLADILAANGIEMPEEKPAEEW